MAALIDVVQSTTLSTSMIVKLIVSGVSSAVVCAAIALITGASFTALTVTLKFRLAVKTPSVTVNVRFKAPLAFSAGVIVAVQLGAVPLKTTFPTGIMAAFEVPALTEVVQLKALSTSEIMKLTVNGVSSGVVCAPMAVMTGASLTAFTVRVNPDELLSAPSVTVKLRLSDPFASG